MTSRQAFLGALVLFLAEAPIPETARTELMQVASSWAKNDAASDGQRDNLLGKLAGIQRLYALDSAAISGLQDMILPSGSDGASHAPTVARGSRSHSSTVTVAHTRTPLGGRASLKSASDESEFETGREEEEVTAPRWRTKSAQIEEAYVPKETVAKEDVEQ
eukprot:GHVU01095662.1.p1 GENE.GHVU01095662.1~~GHVU01095662.1.p1  ORF type:complete len:170 (-),score=16.10 GHVU01095662.1:93-578(-)